MTTTLTTELNARDLFRVETKKYITLGQSPWGTLVIRYSSEKPLEPTKVITCAIVDNQQVYLSDRINGVPKEPPQKVQLIGRCLEKELDAIKSLGYVRKQAFATLAAMNTRG